MAAGKPAKSRRRLLAAILAILVVAAVAGVLYWQERSTRPSAGPSPTWRAEPTSTDAPSNQPAPTARYDLARQQLKQLEVRGWDRTSDFKRYQFGQAWSDDVNVEFGHNGCNTRDDILRRDLKDLVVRPFTCYAQSGTLIDPYSGVTIDFVRSPDTSNAIEIDHVVALSDAWQTGAAQLDPFARSNFANDPLNLQTTIGWVNQQKGDADAATWLPPNKAYRCPFVTRIVDVKSTYNLWVTQAEHDAISSVLGQCDA